MKLNTLIDRESLLSRLIMLRKLIRQKKIQDNKDNFYINIWALLRSLGHMGIHGRLERVDFPPKRPESDTYFFEKYIPIGIQKRPNEKI